MFRPRMYFMMLVVVSSHLMGLVSMQTESGTGTCDSQGLDCHRSVLILNDEWGTSKGGLSTMNRQIALEAKNAGFEVYVTVLDASDDDIDDAYERGIKLEKAKIVDRREPNMDWLTIYHPVHFPDLEKIPNLEIIIGHVPLTSEAAISIQKQRLPHTKVFLFIHVIPEDIEEHKQGWTPEKVEQREYAILQAAEKADVVFSVGPRIFNHFDLKFRGLPKKIDHIEYLPCPEEDFFDITIKEPEANHPVQILTFGRVARVGNLKGYDIVASALSHVTDQYHSMKMSPPIWIVRGVGKGQHEESKEYILKRLTSQGKYLKFNLYPYGTQDKIRRDLQQSHLVLMASRSEPFGLVGLEAIAAGIPVLVTVHSGLAEFIKKEFPAEAQHMMVDVGVNDIDRDEDILIWSRRVIDVLRDNYPARFQIARSMKERLRLLLKESTKVFVNKLNGN